MRIAFDGRLLHRKVTGLERYTWNLLRRFAKDDRSGQYEIYLNEDLLKEGGFPDNFESVVVTDSMDLLSKAVLERKNHRPDIYHLTWTGGCAADILLVKLIPSVLTVHDLISYEDREHFPNDYLFERNRKIVSLGIRFAKRIIADSEYTKRSVCSNFNVDPGHVRTIHLACDEKFTRIDDPARQSEIREKYGIEGKLVFNLGTDFFHKNVKKLILAFNQVADKIGSPATLIIAGNRYCVDGSQEIERELGQSPHARSIKWLEHLPEEDLCAMYNAADVFAFPSLHEGFGLPILEAMACGTPVVACNRTSVPEVAGDAALLVDGTDVAELAEALLSVLTNNNLRKSLIQKGFERAQQFTWKKTAEETLHVYGELFDELRHKPVSEDFQAFWQEWLPLQFQETAHLERQISGLNEALQLREKHLESLLGSRTLNILRRIKRAVTRSPLDNSPAP